MLRMNQIAGLAGRQTALPLIAIVSLALVGCASTNDKLQTAAANGDAERVARLLDAGADPSYALGNAAGAGHAEIVGILLDAGADPSHALGNAAGAGHAEIVGILLDAGADPSEALDDAARAGHAEIVGILLDAGANPSLGLPAAAQRGQTKTVATLLRAGGDPNNERLTYRGRLSLTPLHWAAMEGHLEVVKLLIEAGADIEARAHYSSPGLLETFVTTVTLAALSPFAPDDRLGLEMADMDGWIPLQFATAAGHTEIVDLLTAASSATSVSGN